MENEDGEQPLEDQKDFPMDSRKLKNEK